MPNQIRSTIDSLAGSYSIYQDGNLGRLANSANPPRIAIFGSAERGIDYTPLTFTEDSLDQLPKVFGVTGDMAEQVQEVQAKGEDAVLAVRIGARAPFLFNVGNTAAGSPDYDDGYRIYSVYGGVEYGTRFGVAYATSDNRLIIEDKALSEVVFDNSPTAPIDKGVVYVYGTPQGVADSGIGTISPLASVAWSSVPTSDADVTFYGGDNGTNMCRMRLFESVFKGFASLEGFRYDYLPLPKDATLDCPYDGSLSALANQGTSYPTKNSQSSTQPDKLGKVFIEFINNDYEFYWDVDGDGAAEYYSVNETGTDYSATSKGGVVFAATHFLEPNFAYALAYHCDRTTYESHFVQGIVGVEQPPIGQPLSAWIGSLGTYSTDADGSVTITANGTGLLGHKYVAGNTSYRSAAAWGGMIRTSEPFFDSGTEQKDDNDQPIDMGKYLSLWISPEIFQPVLGVNNNQAYVKISPAGYAAFRAGLRISQSPTNKPLPASRGVMTGRLTRSQRADLSLCRYTYAIDDYKGTRVEDGPSAALPTSDYTRQGTIEIVQFVDDVLRDVADQFIGRNISAEEEVAFQKELDEAMNGLITTKVIRSGVAQLIINANDRILGQANVLVSIEAPFEIRRIFFSVSLRKS